MIEIKKQQVKLKDKEYQQFKTPPLLAGYNYPLEDINKSRSQNSLLTIRLETSLICNLKCIYCNGLTGKGLSGEISFDKMKEVILEAKSLGAQSVVIIGGGEPTIFPYFRQLIKFVNKKGMIPVIFTNGLTLTQDLSYFLYDNNTSVIFKLDSLDEKIQDLLAGEKGTYKLIMRGMQNLFKVGFNKSKGEALRCGASFVVTDINYKDIIDVWQFCRENNIYPNLEELIPRNRGLKYSSKLEVNKQDMHKLKKKILLLDREKYNYDWLIHTPLPGHGCLQFFYSVYITSRGYIQPCADIDIKLYNIKNTTIAAAINKPFFKLVRNIEPKLDGKCFNCDYNKLCVGCRGLAFSLARQKGLNIYHAIVQEDPLCCK
ncbi:MAG: radical SAM protein [Candidatus Omnitrophica bacterium]|jgi:radical SAM protein with 4Fe4S-binding SPASM domain|nr:radical SAM protein [Candidatus Omnitrophota bacterium]